MMLIVLAFVCFKIVYSGCILVLNNYNDLNLDLRCNDICGNSFISYPLVSYSNDTVKNKMVNDVMCKDDNHLIMCNDPDYTLSMNIVEGSLFRLIKPIPSDTEILTNTPKGGNGYMKNAVVLPGSYYLFSNEILTVTNPDWMCYCSDLLK